MELYYTKGTLYIGHYNLWFKVVALFTNDDHANKFMEENEGTAVLTQDENNCVIVMKDDEGEMSV